MSAPAFKSIAEAALARSSLARRLVYARSNRRLFSDFTQHDRMLADQVRVGAYKAGIAKHVAAGDVVIDLGTGTGVLAFLAALRGAEVHAVEHSELIEVAQAVAADNGLDNVEFHRTHSSKLDLGQRVDAIVHEQIGEAAYDERVVENMSDLRDRLLKDGGRIHPRWLDLYIEPVQLREDQSFPFAWEQKVEGIDFRAIRRFASPTHRYMYKVLRPFPLDHFLCEPAPVVSIDLETDGPDDLPTSIAFDRPAVAGGQFEGFCVYFSTRFDDEVGFTSSPASRETSWGNPLLRAESQPISPGDTISLRLTAAPLSRPSTWRWEWSREATVGRSA